MQDFTIPVWVKNSLFQYNGVNDLPDDFYKSISKRFEKFNCDDPEVSIVIPAWNEENNLARTLNSLSFIETNYKVEIIVVNNNSTDKTQELLDRCGVKSYFQPKQGISFTRQMGLEKSKGKIELCADSDTLYPPTWVDGFVEVLKNPEITCAYGKYSFIPPGKTSRPVMALYEMVTNTLFRLRRKHRDYLNVMGFNFGFRVEDALKIGGFNLERTIWEDGWMAMKLSEIGKIGLVKSNKSKAWTMARRLEIDGGLYKSIIKRIKKEFPRLGEYVVKKDIKY
ncbi:MAG TPA: glycosyl transferase family 2 [Bacteroidetes bacterium]|nr:glycosyl transferase family 2 [Bacteroidota bacterium]HCN36261.1 glycosyl transferase family 2 [Bacteroidota bacterium]